MNPKGCGSGHGLSLSQKLYGGNKENNETPVRKARLRAEI